MTTAYSPHRITKPLVFYCWTLLALLRACNLRIDWTLLIALGRQHRDSLRQDQARVVALFRPVNHVIFPNIHSKLRSASVTKVSCGADYKTG
jgi:hypothetical protein